MKRTISLLLLTVLLAFSFLPLAVSADAPTAQIKNLSGVVYPGCKLDLGIAVTGKQVMGLQFSTSIEYNKEQLTVVADPYTTVSGWELAKGSANYLFAPSGMSLEGKDANDLVMVRFAFRLNDSVKIGDKITVTVKNLQVAADGRYTGDVSYDVTVVEKPKNTNCNLLSLKATEGSFTPAFDAESKNSDYAITVPNTITALSLSATTANELASYEIAGNENFEVGENTVTVTVTAESGAQRVYTITVTRKEPPSTDATLSKLEAEEGTLSPEFDPANTDYTVNVPSDVLSLTLSVTTTDSKARYEISGNENFAVGENTVTITVTAENTSVTAVYTLKVIRARPIETNALLAGLEVEGQTLSPIFDGASENREYALVLPYEFETLPAFKVTPAGLYAKYEIVAPEKLEVGENTVVITVTAEDGVTAERYTVKVTREARILSADSSLKSLTPDNGSLSPAFSAEITTYALVTDPELPSIAFSALANDAAATVTPAIKQLELGLNTVTVVCKAENGSETVYTIHVFVPRKEVVPHKELIIDGAPIVGEKLTLRLVGTMAEGSFCWYVGDEKVEGVTGDSYTLLASDVNKTVKAVYTDQEGNELTSQVLTVVNKEVIGLEKQTLSTAELIIMIVLVFVALLLGGVFGMFFTKRSYRHKGY